MSGPSVSASAGSRLHLAASSRLRIIVLGYFVRGPLGGMVWSNLQYVLGLTKVGHDVYFIEDSDEYASCYDPARETFDIDPTYGLQFAERAFEKVGLGERWAYYDAHALRWYGPCAGRIFDICSTADLLLNLCGMNPIRPWLSEIPARALIDEDPAFTQIRHLTDPDARRLASQHTAFLSFGKNIGQQRCSIPNDGFRWHSTHQPVVLDSLTVTPGRANGKFTTVMQWESYPPREHGGLYYGLKADSFQPYVDMPAKTAANLELSVGGPSAPIAMLQAKGWELSNAVQVTRDPWTYQDYIENSKAEFSVAKHAYVVSHSGWFSERSVTYLASGRPVVIQDTGFSDWLETGSGIIAFTTPEQALSGIEEINCRYDFHCRAAREIAREYFDACKVLPRLIQGAMEHDASPIKDGAEESSCR